MRVERGVAWEPVPYMKKAVRFLLEHANAGLVLSPGGRKTSCTLAALKILFDKKAIRKVLIVAPKRPCYTVWPAEIEKWADFNHLTYEILHGPQKDAALKCEAQIYLINPDGLEWLIKAVKLKYQAKYQNKFTGQPGVTERTKVSVDVKAFKSLGFDVLVLDELHLFKHRNSQRFKLLKEVLHTFGRRWGLTGSPAANGLMDLFGQCYVLDLGHALGQYITHFRRDFFFPEPNGVDWTLQPGAEERIYEHVSPLMLRLETDALQQLPQMVFDNIVVDLPAKVRTVYDDLEKDFLAVIQDHIIVAANAAAASTKLRQVACGGIYHTDPLVVGKAAPKRSWTNLHDEKTNALLELVEGLQGSPLLVAYDFDHDLDRLRKAFPKAVFACDVPDAKFRLMEDRWNSGEIETLFGHPQSIGLGLNLQGRGNHVCWHSPIWDYTLYDQFNRRVLRSGNKHEAVFIHHLVARNTLEDMVIIPTLRVKEKTQNALFGALLDYAKVRSTR